MFVWNNGGDARGMSEGVVNAPLKVAKFINRVCVMGIDSPFGWRGGSGGGIVVFELLDGHITQKFVDVGRKVDGSMRPSVVGSARRIGFLRVETLGGLLRLVVWTW